MSYTLYAAKGCGSAIVELVLLRLGQTYNIDWLTWGQFGERQGYGRLNPLLQVPTLVVGDQLISESLAICTWLNARHGGNLVPTAQSPLLADYARWSVFLVASLYPTFFYGDHPERWVSHEPAQRELRKTTDLMREKMWAQLEGAARGPFFLGEQESLIDAYLAIMVHWRPGRDWFQQHAPKVETIARHVAQNPLYAPIFAQFTN